MTDRDTLEEAAALLRGAGRLLALTGAGISAESGIPTFRGPGGLWRNYRATDLATPEAFARDPTLVWEWYRWRRSVVRAAAPNPGHDVLARFEQRWAGFLLATQNVDGLHARAGSRRLVELHGNIWRARCASGCGRTVDEYTDVAPPDELTVRTLPRCPCGGLLRPDIVWFGEALDGETLDRTFDAAAACDVLLVVGTSSVVYPAAAVPEMARRQGAAVVDINMEDTPLTPHASLSLRGASGVVLPALEGRL